MTGTACVRLVSDEYRSQKLAVHRQARSKTVKWCCIAAVFAVLSGCGVAAAPCRIASAGLKIVPVVGHVAAAPTDACADVIDP
jgi:hypothetical protein